MRYVDIEQRRKKILCAIIETYINTGAPVASRSVAQMFRWSMSPATVRNVMADLEEMELITHPHTSAGRIPTEKGYRFYVDSLLEPRRLTKEEEVMINKLLNRTFEDFDALMQAYSKAISLITSVAGVVLTPRLRKTIFKRIEFIQIAPTRLLVVLITGSGMVRNYLMDLEEEFTKEELSRISNFLNSELKGMFLSDIKDYLTYKMLEYHDSFYAFLKRALFILSMPNLLNMQEKMYYDGTATLMSYPEFRDISKAKMFLKLLEEKRGILELFYEDMEEEGVKVHIGLEDICKDIQDCSVVTCNYKIKDRIAGSIGAIGPMRMEYGKIISALKYISELLGRALEGRDRI